MEWINSNNRTILWAIPRQPQGFLNQTVQPPTPGTYIFGQLSFQTRELSFVAPLQRRVAGTAEDFLLGFISVLLIAILSEIVQSVLLYRRRGLKRGEDDINTAAAPTGSLRRFLRRVAVAVDDVLHARNIYRNFQQWRRKSQSQSDFSTSGGSSLGRAAVVAILTTSLFLANMLVVYLTQPVIVNSGRHDYNIVALQPSSTDQELSRLAHRISRELACVTLGIKEANPRQIRDFSFSPCLMYETVQNHDGQNETISEIEVGSWYHRYGSDHVVKFGRASIAITSRAYLYTRCGEAAWRILFDTRDTPEFEHAKYIQDLFIYSVMEENCNRDYETRTCQDFVNEMTSQSTIQPREIQFREAENVTGLVSVYTVAIRDPWRNIDEGIYPLTTTAVLKEVTEPARYEHFDDGQLADGIFGLINEQGRVFGLASFSIALLSSFVLLIALRLLFRPTSLGEMAVTSISGIDGPCSLPSSNIQEWSEQEYEDVEYTAWRISRTFQAQTSR